jgi:hypothetical protein
VRADVSPPAATLVKPSDVVLRARRRLFVV